LCEGSGGGDGGSGEGCGAVDGYFSC
jgi:hypothetical protein